MMDIIDTNLAFRGSMANRSRTNRIIIHHAEASTCSAEDIHRWHLANGWSGAGYHFLVRKDGSIYRLRPEGKVGAHSAGSNSDSIGICFEGSYNSETMPQAQVDAGRELVAYLKDKYGISKIQRHRDVCDTDCPGANFPFDAIVVGSAPQPVTPPVYEDKPTASGDAWTRELQAECNAQGFSSQAVDGIPGPVTLAGCPTLRQGARGNITRLMQAKLISLGYPVGSYGADGVFGAGTASGVRAFQAARGLVVDGIVGQDTWRKLLGL